MSKIGVAVGEEFPLQDLDGSPPDPADERQAESDDKSRRERSRCGHGRHAHGHDHGHDHADYARWKWHREGQRHWDEDVQAQHAEWEAKARAFREKIRAAIHDRMHAGENRRHHHAHGHSHRSSAWHKAAVGLGLAALAFAIHRHRHKHAADMSARPPGDEPIVTPPPPREV